MVRVRARSEVKFEARESVRVSLALNFADVAQQAEHNVANVDVAGSIPAFRSTFRCTFTLLTRVERTHIINDARLAQLAKSSRLVSGRSSVRTRQRAPHFLPTWWNRQTRQPEELVAQAMPVQIRPSAPTFVLVR